MILAIPEYEFQIHNNMVCFIDFPDPEILISNALGLHASSVQPFYSNIWFSFNSMFTEKHTADHTQHTALHHL